MNETLKRSLSGAVYILLLIISIVCSVETFFILFGLFLIIAVYEFCALVHINKVLPIIIAVLMYGSVTYLESQNQHLSDNFYHTLLAAAMIVSFRCMFFLFDKKTFKLDTVSNYIFLFGYIILPFIIISKIPFSKPGVYNFKIIVGIFILIWINDTFAYIVGKSIGKHKLFERISPKKTIEGFLGGIFFAIIAGFIISKFYIIPNVKFQEKSIIIWCSMGLIVGVFGTIGDLIESKFKRIAGVKDSGAIMPGHGGVLDRLDSVIFAAPFLYLFYTLLNLFKL